MDADFGDDVTSILVLFGGALGDVVLCVPTLRLIRARFPKATLTFLADPYSAGIIEGLPYVDEIVETHPKNDGLVGYLKNIIKLRKRRFDLVLDVHGTGRSRIQTVILNGRRRVGFARHKLVDHIYHYTVPKWRVGHRVDSFQPVLKLLGIYVPTDQMTLELPISPEQELKASAVLSEAGINGSFAVIHPTTSGRPENELWADANFAEVATGLVKRGLQVAMTSGPDGAGKIASIQALADVPIANLAGKTDQLVLAAILRRASLYMGYNTGPMHISAATNTPIVAIFENPAKYEPWHPHMKAPWHVFIPKNVNEGSDSEPLYVADTISPAEVLTAVDGVLAKVAPSS